MCQTVELVALQMTSTPVPEENINWVEQVLTESDISPGAIVVLPECFSCFGSGDQDQLNIREPKSGGVITQRLCEIARKTQTHIFAGTMPTESMNENKFYASCRYIDNCGQPQEMYNKIHLFDVSIGDNTGTYRESAKTLAGEKVVVVNIGPIKVGIAVCYDIRFAGLFDAMGDIDILVLPSAFTQKTGEAHWELLVRARAIEKQCFVIAANQSGVHANGRQTFGHSMIVSPWGDILVQKSTGLGYIKALAELATISKVKQSIPVQQHRKFRSYFVE